MSYRCGECVFADGVGQRIMIAGSLGIPACASATLGGSEQQVLRSRRLCQSHVILVTLGLGLLTNTPFLGTFCSISNSNL